MKLEYTDYQYAKYRMLEPPIWHNHYESALTNFEESAEAGEARGTFMLGKILLLWSKNEADAAIGIRWLEKAAAMGYKVADEFLDFYRTFGKPITRELLESVTLETENAPLLCLAGQLKFFDCPLSGFRNEGHPKALEGIALLKKAAEKGHLEAVRFLFEAYFGYGEKGGSGLRIVCWVNEKVLKPFDYTGETHTFIGQVREITTVNATEIGDCEIVAD